MSNSTITNQCYRKKVEGNWGMKEVAERGKKTAGKKINDIDSSEDQLWGGTEGELDWIPLDTLSSQWCTKLLASALPGMCFYKDLIKLMPPNPLEQLMERLRMDPTKANVSLSAFILSFPTRSGHWSGEADYMDGPAWGKLVPSGLSHGDTEHSVFCNCKSGSFHQCKFCSEAVGFFF